MSKKFPEIRIKDGWYLRTHASQYLHELWGKDSPLADDEWMEWRVGEYDRAWKQDKDRLLHGMCEALDLEFRQNIVDVYIAPWFNAFSDPMVIGVTREPDEFVDILTHELIHRLLTDNTSLPHDTQLLPRWESLFGKRHSFDCVVHIPVHAVHKALYLDVLHEPERLRRDIAFNKETGSTDYVKAWQYVEEHGYKEIIRKLAEDYKK